MRLSRRVMDECDGHIEVCSDLDDQGIFFIRDDLIKWIIRNFENNEWVSIRDELVPSLLKNQYKGNNICDEMFGELFCFKPFLINFGELFR